jgi:hypothetical protein
MKRDFILYLIIIICVSLNLDAQNTTESELFQLDLKEHNNTEILVFPREYCDTIVLDSSRIIEGLALTGMIIQPKHNSFVRIVLQDKEGKEYIVLETNKLYNDVDTLILNNYCEETKYLPDICPYLLRIYTNDAYLDISCMTIQIAPKGSNGNGERNAKRKRQINDNKLGQAQFIANLINENNCKHHKLWRAEVTEISIMSWEEKKRVLGIDERCCPTGFEYYSSGIFEIGNSDNLIRSPNTSPYVDSFDWRNRHGINWITSVKDQSTGGSCWAFAAVGVTEALVNIYFNKKLDYDLSEQEVVSCSGCGNNASGGSEGSALGWISTHGISEEASFPFSNSDEPCSNQGAFCELITMSGTSRVYDHRINNNDSVKNALIKYGPLASGFMYNSGSYVGHCMTLVGYSTIHEGDTIRFFNSYNQSPNNFVIIQNGDNRIGQTYWIFKNSYGNKYYFQHEGYSYILFYDQSCFRTPYYAKTPIMSLLYSDSDIAVTDFDGDGLFNWGIGTKPSHCPCWADESDGDDSDPSKGHMNEFGYCENLPSNHPTYEYISNDSTLTTFECNSNYIGIIHRATVTLQTQPTFTNGTKVLLDKGATLIIDGFTVNFDFLQPYPGSKIVLINGAKVLKPFVTPLGVEFVINQGSIE